MLPPGQKVACGSIPESGTMTEETRAQEGLRVSVFERERLLAITRLHDKSIRLPAKHPRGPPHRRRNSYEE